jgi:hypothetical protein
VKKRKWLLLAFLLTFTLPAAALCAPDVMKALLWRFGSDPAVSVLRGEYLGRILCGVLLTAMPFTPLLCFLLERAVLGRARRRRENAKPPELATAEERRAFYLRELAEERREPPRTPWIAYAALCGLGMLVFGFGVLGIRLTGKIEKTGRDLELYRAGTPALYVGPLLLVDRPVRDGAKQIPDERYVYYHSATEGDLQCAVTLITETQLMQPSYRVEYLPETGTILTITDMAGVLRTGGEDLELSTPAGCWLYGDLVVPICGQVEGYGALTREQKALFDLLYSQVLSGDVAAGNLSTRSFDLPYPLEKAEFREVLELYEASVGKDEYPNHGYRTDDGRIVRRAYCYGIIHSQ